MDMEKEGKGNMINVVIEGMKRKWGGDRDDPVEMNVPSDCTFDEIWRRLEEDYGYCKPSGMRKKGHRRFRHKGGLKYAFHPFDAEFEIVSDKSAADETHIYINEPLVAGTNRNQEVDFEIQHDGGDRDSLKIDDDLELIFHRTVRMPDDDRLHSLPASLGTFPLYNTEDYTSRLPSNILKKGGLFLPMWQREALWIGLGRPKLSPDSKSYRSEIYLDAYAIRVYVGQINAITGQNMKEEIDSQRKQDYLVFPGQTWIDGICVAPGVVRQFVAMPLGSGYTVEGQKTGEEKHGGLQIEIIPAFRQTPTRWLAATVKPEYALYEKPDLYFDETKTPAELGLEVGTKVRVYPSPATYTVPVEVRDIAVGGEDSGNDVTHLQLEAHYYDAWNIPSDSFGRIAHGTIMPEDTCGPSMFLTRSPTPPSPSTSDIGGNSAPLSSEGSDHEEFGMGSTSRGKTSRGKSRFVKTFYEPTPSSSEPNRQPRPVLNVKAMGLAAGGKLVQDIATDYKSPNMWNVNAARLINIHILDPISCESVTHIVPPPIPMSVHDAVLAKLPFFVVEEQIDNRLEGGDFDNVKSVSKTDEAKGIASEPTLDPNQPVMCSSCERRLCDCVVRPCDHQFCNVCIRAIESAMEGSGSNGVRCPRCNETISRVAGFAAPMNLPGEELIRSKMPVRVLKIDDGRVKFRSIRQTRV